jgi:hypothetical protein
MMDWIMRRLFPRMAAERDAELAILDRMIEQKKEQIRRLLEEREAERQQGAK